MIIRIWLSLIWLTPFWNAVAQIPDSTRASKIYSTGLFVSTGFGKIKLGFAQTFVNRMTQGSSLEGIDIDMQSVDSKMRTMEIGLQVGWKIKKLRSRNWRFIESGLSVSVLRSEGRYGMAIVKVDPLDQTSWKNVFVGSFDISGLSLRPGIFVHSRSFFTNFALAAGAEAGLIYGNVGPAQNPFLDIWLNKSGASADEHVILYKYTGSMYQVALPIHVKYNASCDLNIEFIFRPTWLLFHSDVNNPDHWSRTSNFGFLLRYKLNTNPVNTNNRRRDVFF